MTNVIIPEISISLIGSDRHNIVMFKRALNLHKTLEYALINNSIGNKQQFIVT